MKLETKIKRLKTRLVVLDWDIDQMIIRQERMSQFWNEKQKQQYLKTIDKMFDKQTDTYNTLHRLEIAGGSRKRRDILRKTYYKFTRVSRNNYIDKRRKAAEEHYHNSIMKLAMKLRDKGMELGQVKIHSIDINNNGIDIVLTDGQNTVRAWTIIASGPIQRPHFRYLVK